MKNHTDCPVCVSGYLIPYEDTEYCSDCGTEFKTVKAVKQAATQFDKAEALDRIHVIQTMLSELLGFDGDMCTHKGLSHDAEWLVSEAMEKLCEAYQRQAASWEWTDAD